MPKFASIVMRLGVAVLSSNANPETERAVTIPNTINAVAKPMARFLLFSVLFPRSEKLDART